MQLFINNKFVDAKSGKKIPVIDPRTEKTILEVDEGGLEDVDAAVQAASEAFTTGPWPKTAAAVSHPLVAYLSLFDHMHGNLASWDTKNTTNDLCAGTR